MSLSTKYFFNMRLALGAKAWIPIIDNGDNRDLIDYIGLGSVSVNSLNRNSNW